MTRDPCHISVMANVTLLIFMEYDIFSFMLAGRGWLDSVLRLYFSSLSVVVRHSSLEATVSVISNHYNYVGHIAESTFQTIQWLADNMRKCVHKHFLASVTSITNYIFMYVNIDKIWQIYRIHETKIDIFHKKYRLFLWDHFLFVKFCFSAMSVL